MPVRLEYSTSAKCKPEQVWRKFEKLEEWAWLEPLKGEAEKIARGEHAAS